MEYYPATLVTVETVKTVKSTKTAVTVEISHSIV